MKTTKLTRTTKMKLGRETLRRLTDDKLSGIAGGLSSRYWNCSTDHPSHCECDTYSCEGTGCL